MKPREFLAQIAQLSMQFQAQIEAQVAGFDPDPAASTRRREQAGHDAAIPLTGLSRYPAPC